MSAHRCYTPTDEAVAAQVDEVVMSAPLSLALGWYDEDGLRLVFDRACAREDRMHDEGLCLACGRPEPKPTRRG